MQLWNMTSGKPLLPEPPRRHREPVHAMTLSPAGDRLASRAGDGFLIWDAPQMTAVQVTGLKEPHAGPFSPDGRTLYGALATAVVGVDAASG